MNKVLAPKMKELFTTTTFPECVSVRISRSKELGGNYYMKFNFPLKMLMVVIPGFLVLFGFFLQGCTTVENNTKIVMKKNENPGAVNISLPRIGKAPKDVSEIPDGDFCRLNPSHPTCLDRRQLSGACPGQKFLDSIPAVPQLTSVWCWAGSGESQSNAYGVPKEQCNLVQQVYNLPVSCCLPPNVPNVLENQYDVRCLENGWPHDAFKSGGIDFEYSRIALPEKKIYQVLCESGPITYVVANDDGSGHTLEIKGVEILNDELYLITDDHSWRENDQGRRESLGFGTKVSYLDYVNGNWLALPDSHHFVSYFEIKPLP